MISRQRNDRMAMSALAGTTKRALRRAFRASNRRLLWWVVLPVAVALSRFTGSARWQLRVGEAHHRLRRHGPAVEAWERAAERSDCRPEWLLRRGQREEQRGASTAAARLYRAGLRIAPADQVLAGSLADALEASGRWSELVELSREAPALLSGAPERRLRLADALYRTGHWEAAREHLEDHLDDDPRDARSHRQLARVLRELWEWRGSFDGSTDQPEGASFRALAPGEPERALGRAVEALREAVELKPATPAWQGALGELQEAAGDLDGAISNYEAAVTAIAASSKRSSFKTLHQWEFALQRARHLAGRGQVDDPLFRCEASIVEPVEEPPEQPIGFYRLTWNFAGMGIAGFVTQGDVDRIEVLLDGVKLREVNVSHATFLPGFGLSITRPAIERLPDRGRLEVRTTAGERLLARGRGTALALSVPHGDGGAVEVLAAGGMIDKKGELPRSMDEVSERQSALLDLYVRAHQDVEALAGTPLFVLYGTLLGCHRSGALIPGDDDFDVGFVSRERDPRAVKRETMDLMLELVRAGYTVSFNRSGRLFRLHGDERATYGIHLDVHPVWFDHDGAWVHNQAHFPATVDDFLPPGEIELAGRRVLMPRRPEPFLEHNYGPGWRVPDPGFMHDPGDVAPRVRSRLAKALITPDEYRELASRIEAERASRPGMGRLVSVGSQPLYPLEDFVP
jgi:hypothetical protein